MRIETTIRNARLAAVEDIDVSGDGRGIGHANLRNGDSVTVIATRGQSGRVRCHVTREPGHFTTMPTGGLADQIRDARRDVCGR